MADSLKMYPVVALWYLPIRRQTYFLQLKLFSLLIAQKRPTKFRPTGIQRKISQIILGFVFQKTPFIYLLSGVVEPLYLGLAPPPSTLEMVVMAPAQCSSIYV